MTNYLPVYLSSSVRTWLLGLLSKSVHSWTHLCWLFTSNFQATCTRLRFDWDLASIIQKKGESLQEFIQCFCNRRNIIPEVVDKSIIMFFKKGLRDSSLIHKVIMKNSRTSEEMLAIANKYSLAEDVTHNNREQKKEKELGHMDQPSSSKGHDSKRKVVHYINLVECPCHNKEYWPSRMNLKAS
jgi:hypothetical protein